MNNRRFDNRILNEMIKSHKKGRLKYLLEEYVTIGKDGYSDSRTYIDGEGYYHVKPIAESSTQCYIVCPHCKSIHVHGNGGGAIGGCAGYRVPHCQGINNFKQYEIIELEKY